MARSALLLTFLLPFGAVSAQAPGEVGGVGFDDPTTLAWDAAAGADEYHVYRGVVSEIAAGIPGRCHGYAVDGTTFVTPAPPAPGDGFFYLVTGVSAAGEEGPAGLTSSGSPRPLLGSCEAVMRTHVLNRVGYGWDEWSAQRIAALGIEGYLDEQLDPLNISELDNVTLNTRLDPLVPPLDLTKLVAQHVVRGLHARRQLEQQTTEFWVNHFSTFWLKIENWFNELFPDCEGAPPCDPSFPAKSQYEASQLQDRETQAFRAGAFYGTFRQMLEASALSPAMMVYLDTVLNVASAPNENYAREIMELSAMGVDNGYTQSDIEELARALTGWTVCNKAAGDVGDPLAPCIGQYWGHNVGALWVPHFDPSQHDCGSKMMFFGTAQQFTIPSTCASPQDGLDDMTLALDHIAAHPSTARFVSFKLLERFVTDEPTEEMIDAVVAEWNDASNPRGVGDMQEVLRAVLTLPAFLDPDLVGSKIKTPLEHAIAMLRATRGKTNGVKEMSTFLAKSGHQPYLALDPTGWPEAGFRWINTNATLERQNLAYNLMLSHDPDFSADPVQLLVDSGVSIFPGNAAAIVDFFGDLLFGGALTPAERQAAIDFLNTDDLGNVTPYNADRIRETVAVLLGYPQFLEQ